MLDSFGRTRLLAFDRDPATRHSTVEVSHEALLREWPRLRGWLDEGRGEVRLQRQLAQAAAEWRAAQQDPSFLLTGARLAQYEGWLTSATVALTQDERALVTASLAERDRRAQEDAARRAREVKLERRARRVLQALVAVFLVAAVVAGGLAGWANDRRIAALAAEQQAVSNLNLSEAQRLAAESKTLILENGDATTAALLALRSLNLRHTLQGDAVLSQVLYLEYPTQVFTGHTGMLSDVGFLPDQRSIYTVGAEDVGSIRFWDLASGAVTRSLDVPGGCFEVDISADGQVMAAACLDEVVYLWSLATGEEIRQIPNQASNNPRVRFSPDSRQLISGGTDTPARLWDVETGALIRTFETEDPLAAPALGMAFTPDGRQVVIGGQDGVVRLWDVATGAVLREFRGHTDWVWGVAVSPDGRYVASTGFDHGGTRLWDLRTGDLVRRFPHPNVTAYTLEFSADGRYLLTGGWDATARLWDVESGLEVRRFSQPQVTWAVALSADGRYALTGSWDTVARLWDLDPSLGLTRFASVTRPAYGVLSPDGSWLALAGGDGVVSIVSAETGQPQSQVTGHAAGLYDIDFSPDGRYLATTSAADGVTRVSDLTSGTTLWEDHVSGGQSVQFSKDGLSLLVVGHDDAVWILRALTGEVLRKFRDAEYQLYGVYSPGNETIAASPCCSPRVLMWDIVSGQVSRTLTTSEVTRALAYSADGRYLATSGDGGTIRLWDAATGAEIRRLVGHGNTVERALAFSHDGRYIASGGYDRTARIWEVATGEQIRQFSGFTEGILSVAFTPDDSRLLIVSADGVVQLTYARLQDAIADLCRRLVGDLDAITRARYAITDPGPTCARTSEP